MTGWTVASEEAPGFFGAPNTWINVSVTLAAPVTGALHIEGRMTPRRLGQFAEGRGVPARDTNTELNRITAALREFYDWMTPARQTLRDQPILDLVTAGINGLMRSADYLKLLGIAPGATANTKALSSDVGTGEDTKFMTDARTAQAIAAALSDPVVAVALLNVAAPALPTSLPAQPNRFWNQGGILSIS